MFLLEGEVWQEKRMSRAFCSCKLSCCRSSSCSQTTSSVTSTFVCVPALLWRKLQKARTLLPLGMPCIEMQVGMIDENNGLLDYFVMKSVCYVLGSTVRNPESDISKFLPCALDLQCQTPENHTRNYCFTRTNSKVNIESIGRHDGADIRV